MAKTVREAPVGRGLRAGACRSARKAEVCETHVPYRGGGVLRPAADRAESVADPKVPGASAARGWRTFSGRCGRAWTLRIAREAEGAAGLGLPPQSIVTTVPRY